MRQIEGFRIGPVAVPFRDLTDTFAEMEAEARRLGLSTAGLPEELARATAALSRDIRLQQHGVMEMVGVFTPLDRALSDLQVQMEAAASEAARMGISTAGVVAEHQRRIALLVQESRGPAAVRSCRAACGPGADRAVPADRPRTVRSAAGNGAGSDCRDAHGLLDRGRRQGRIRPLSLLFGARAGPALVPRYAEVVQYTQCLLAPVPRVARIRGREHGAPNERHARFWADSSKGE
jgi:hypothetical protein